MKGPFHMSLDRLIVLQGLAERQGKAQEAGASSDGFKEYWNRELLGK